MIAYCGIDCSKCKSYIATQSGKREELEKVANELEKIYHAEVKPEYVRDQEKLKSTSHSW